MVLAVDGETIPIYYDFEVKRKLLSVYDKEKGEIRNGESTE